MQVRLVFTDFEGYGKITSKIYNYCDNLLVKKELDSEVYDREKDVNYYNFTVEFDCFILQTKENTHLRFEHVFSVEVI